MSKEPKILLYDIEVSHAISAHFGLKVNGYLPHTNILYPAYMISASWKWLGKDKIHSVSLLDDMKTFKKDRRNDLVVAKGLADAISQADLVIGHNSESFDYKWLTGRLIKHRLDPIHKPVSLDTYKLSKKLQRVETHRLDFLGAEFEVGRKIKTSNWLWLTIVDPRSKDSEVIAAIKEMVRYNKQDVRLLEDVYLRLRPYITNHPNIGLLIGGGEHKCPNCGSHKIQKRGYAYTKTSKKQRYQCTSCAAWSVGETLETTKIK